MINTVNKLSDICIIKNGIKCNQDIDGIHKLYNGGIKIYKTNDKSNLSANTDYIIIHKQSGTITYIRKEDSINCCIGNNAIYLKLRDDTDGKVLLRFIYFMLLTRPYIIKNLQHGSNQQTIRISDISKITCGMV